jgi:hypothetical protein
VKRAVKVCNVLPAEETTLILVQVAGGGAGLDETLEEAKAWGADHRKSCYAPSFRHLALFCSVSSPLLRSVGTGSLGGLQEWLP